MPVFFLLFFAAGEHNPHHHITSSAFHAVGDIFSALRGRLLLPLVASQFVTWPRRDHGWVGQQLSCFDTRSLPVVAVTWKMCS